MVSLIVVLHNVFIPDHSAYISSYFYLNTDLKQHSKLVKHTGHALSIIVQAYWVLILTFSSGFCEFLPLMFSLRLTARFRNLHRKLDELSEGQTLTLTRPHSMPANKDRKYICPRRIEDNMTRDVCMLVKEHFGLQRQVAAFNKTFSPHLVGTLFQCFIVSLCLSYSIVKLDFDHPASFILYFGNLCLFLSKALAFLHFHAQVGSKFFSSLESGFVLYDKYDPNVFFAASAREFKPILVGLLLRQNGINSICSPERMADVLFAVVDETNISAGGYVHFTKSLLLSYYGILGTYITVLLQTV